MELFTLFTAGSRPSASDDSENLVLAHDQQLFTVDLDFRTGVLAEQNTVAGLNIQGLTRSVFFVLARSGRNHFAFLRFLFGAVRNNNSAAHLFAFVNSLHDHA